MTRPQVSKPQRRAAERYAVAHINDAGCTCNANMLPVSVNCAWVRSVRIGGPGESHLLLEADSDATGFEFGPDAPWLLAVGIEHATADCPLVAFTERFMAIDRESGDIAAAIYHYPPESDDEPAAY